MTSPCLLRKSEAPIIIELGHTHAFSALPNLGATKHVGNDDAETKGNDHEKNMDWVLFTMTTSAFITSKIMHLQHAAQ